jgi:hypothetical protein
LGCFAISMLAAVMDPVASGAWRKMRINQAQEFVIGAYTLGGTSFDAPDLRLLRRQPAPVRWTNEQRLHSVVGGAIVWTVPGPGDRSGSVSLGCELLVARQDVRFN